MNERNFRLDYRWLVVLLALLAFALRAGTLTTQSFWRDEVDALCYAYEFPHLAAQTLAPERTGPLETPCACPPAPLAPGHSDSLPTRLLQTVLPMVKQNGPLYFFLLRGWIALSGSSEYALRFFSLWFGVLIVPLTYVLGRRLLGPETGAAGAVLVAVSPYITWYSQEVKMYTLLPVLAVLAVYALRRAADEGGVWWTAQVLATSLAFYIHIWSALLVPVQMALLLAWWPRWRGRYKAALLSLALLTLPYLPLALWQARAVLRSRETGFAYYSLWQMGLVLLNGWGLGIIAAGWPWLEVVCSGIAALGLVTGLLSPAQRRTTLGLLGWLIVPVIGVWLVSLHQPLFTDRYLIWLAPAFYLLTGLGIAAAGRRSRWLALFGLASILVIFGANLWLQTTTPIKSDMRGAAAWVEEQYRPGELIVFQIPHAHYTFDYYFGPTEYDTVDGPYTNYRQDNGDYMRSEEQEWSYMRAITRGYDTVWLVASEVTMWDERNLTQRWLEENGEMVTQAHFSRVDVYCYRLSNY